MFGNLGNLGNILQRARQLGGQVDEITRDLKQRRTVGSAGGGMVEIEVNGVQEVIGCRIDPSLLAQNDAEFLEDLIVGATNQAMVRSREMQLEAMKSLTGGMDMSSLREAMNKIVPGAMGDDPEPTPQGPRG
jgi:DNA-binding YbaB/EbfC family protein